jgi:CheY-like chemotaxis protein
MKDKKLIIAIEDDVEDADAIYNILFLEYDIEPIPGSDISVELICSYSTYNNREHTIESRKASAEIISNFLEKYREKVVCYIIDYRLKESEAALIKNINGVEFCINFRDEMGNAPILFLTSTNQNTEFSEITTFIDQGAKSKRAAVLIKEGGDSWKDSTAFKVKLIAKIEELINKSHKDLPPAKV